MTPTPRRPLLPARDTAAALAAWREALRIAQAAPDDAVDAEVLDRVGRATAELAWVLARREWRR